jgi:hypothetical protein
VGQVFSDDAASARYPQDNGRTILGIDSGAKHPTGYKQAVSVSDQRPDRLSRLFQLTRRTLKIAMVNGQKETVSILFDQPTKTVLHSPVHIKILLFCKGVFVALRKKGYLSSFEILS